MANRPRLLVSWMLSRVEFTSWVEALNSPASLVYLYCGTHRLQGYLLFPPPSMPGATSRFMALVPLAGEPGTIAQGQSPRHLLLKPIHLLGALNGVGHAAPLDVLWWHDPTGLDRVGLGLRNSERWATVQSPPRPDYREVVPPMLIAEAARQDNPLYDNPKRMPPLGKRWESR